MKKVFLLYLFLCLSLLGFAWSAVCCHHDPPKVVIAHEQSDPSGDDQKSDSTTVSKDTTKVETSKPTVPFQGTVEVSFKIEADGTINIINISANNPELIQYVVSKLEKIKLDPEYKDLGKTIKYRFEFGKEA